MPGMKLMKCTEMKWLEINEMKINEKMLIEIKCGGRFIKTL